VGSQSTFVEALRLAQEEILRENPKAFLIGEGVPDEKAIFGTTKGLKDLFPSQVFDSPVSEAAVTGVCLGASLQGMMPIMTFQRIDFALYAMDQIVNNVAKWKTMFGEPDRKLPFIMRMTVGRGWGQGVQHSQNLEALFAHIPGLRVIVPHDPCSAYWLLKEAAKASDPTIFIEHRWLHNMKGSLRQDESHNHYPGEDLTIISWGPAAQLCKENRNGCELIILNNLSRTSCALKGDNYLIVSDDWSTYGCAAEFSAQIAENYKGLKFQVKRITCPQRYIPSSPLKSDDYYPSAQMIVQAINDMTGKDIPIPVKSVIPHDVDPYVGKVTSLI
jgi:pyruvate/2-oxoglutarate/acetoin dehydrogenase E1 component